MATEKLGRDVRNLRTHNSRRLAPSFRRRTSEWSTATPRARGAFVSSPGEASLAAWVGETEARSCCVRGSDMRLLLDEFEDQLGYPGRLLDDQAVGGIGDGDQRRVRAGLQTAALLVGEPDLVVVTEDDV